MGRVLISAWMYKVFFLEVARACFIRLADISKPSGNDDLVKKIDELISALNTHSTSIPTTTGDTISNVFSDIKDMMAKQLDKHAEIASHLRDTKDLTDKLLKVTM